MENSYENPPSESSQGRIFALGDVHGCAAALETLLGLVPWQPSDTLVTLGDYVDRGPDTPRVMEQLLALESRVQLKPLLGNHELMMLLALDEPSEREMWLQNGGAITLESYGVDMGQIPATHVDFFRRCKAYVETDRHFFVHANYTASLPLKQQPEFTLFWEHLSQHMPGPHLSGKTAIVGHTPQRHGEVLDLGHLICIDTYCYGGGWLTLLDVVGGEYWQANRHGDLRNGGPRRLSARG